MGIELSAGRALGPKIWTPRAGYQYLLVVCHPESLCEADRQAKATVGTVRRATTARLHLGAHVPKATTSGLFKAPAQSERGDNAGPLPKGLPKLRRVACEHGASAAPAAQVAWAAERQCSCRKAGAPGRPPGRASEA